MLNDTIVFEDSIEGLQQLMGSFWKVEFDSGIEKCENWSFTKHHPQTLRIIYRKETDVGKNRPLTDGVTTSKRWKNSNGLMKC